MIQITLRPLEGTSPSEERIQRPERPQRANRPPGNTSPLQSYIIRAHTGQNASGREELPRPNAPAHDENYNNRSISPLFASQSSSLMTDSYYHTQRVVPVSQISSSAPPCESRPSGPQLIDVEYSESQPASSPNNPEFRLHSNSGLSAPVYNNHNQVAREEQQDHIRNRNWTDRRLSHSRSSSTDRQEEQGQSSGSLPGTPRRTERSLPQRLSRSGNYREDGQELSVPSIRNTFSLNPQWGERRPRMPRLVGMNSTGNYIPFQAPNSVSSAIAQNWEMWSGVGGLPRRSLRRELRPENNGNVEPMAIPPLINLVEGEDEVAENYMPQDMRINMNENQTSNMGNSQNPEGIAWEEDMASPEDNVNVIEDEEEEEEEEGFVGPICTSTVPEEDNEILLSVPPEDCRNSSESASLSSRNTDVRHLVLSALECPVCFDYVAPPIVQCYEGHLVCNKCRLRLNHCPECRGPFSNVRPRAIEKIASFLEYPCGYDGCMQLVNPAHRIVHAKSCSYRNFICPISPSVCAWTGKKLELRNHMTNFHGRQPHWVFGSKLIFTIQPQVGREQVFIMETLDHYFLVRFVVAVQDKLRGCVTLLGYDASRAESMNVIILVQSTDRPCPCLMVSRSPAEENDEMDMRLEKFAVFNISQLIQSTSTPSSITVKVAVDKKDILRRLELMFD